LRKSKGAAAGLAADKAFQTPASLPLRDDPRSGPASHEGRRHLGGAFSIRLDRIRPDPTQPRRQFDATAHNELAASIKKLGVLQPITVRYVEADDIYQIITGERRYRAVQAIGLTEIPCWVKVPKSEEVLVHQIVENWHRKELHPFEIADALAQLRDANGYSQRQLAAETGKPEAEISKFLKLLELSPTVQKEAREDATGVLSFRHLYNIARLQPGEQAAIATAVRDQRLSAVDTERLVKDEIARRTRPPKRGAPVTKIEYFTSKAKVLLVFRKQVANCADILEALDEARAKAVAAAKKTTLRIHRPK
jgi:ParB family chromosome partitioning protein